MYVQAGIGLTWQKHSWEHYSSIRNRNGPHTALAHVVPQLATDTVEEASKRQRAYESELMDASRPASGVEKAVLASVPGCSLQQARKALLEARGNVNAAVDKLLEGGWEGEEEEGEEEEEGMRDEGPGETDEETTEGKEQAQDGERDDNRSEANNGHSGKASGTRTSAGRAGRRISARERKQQAKQAQKARALARKRKQKDGTVRSAASAKPEETLALVKHLSI